MANQKVYFDCVQLLFYIFYAYTDIVKKYIKVTKQKIRDKAKPEIHTVDFDTTKEIMKTNIIIYMCFRT